MYQHQDVSDFIYGVVECTSDRDCFGGWEMEPESRIRNTFPWNREKTSEIDNCSNMTLLQMFHCPGQVSLYFPASSSSSFS